MSSARELSREYARCSMFLNDSADWREASRKNDSTTSTVRRSRARCVCDPYPCERPTRLPGALRPAWTAIADDACAGMDKTKGRTTKKHKETHYDSRAARA